MGPTTATTRLGADTEAQATTEAVAYRADTAGRIGQVALLRAQHGYRRQPARRQWSKCYVTTAS